MLADGFLSGAVAAVDWFVAAAASVGLLLHAAAAAAMSAAHLHRLCLVHDVLKGSHLGLKIQNLDSNNLPVGQAVGSPHHGTAKKSAAQHSTARPRSAPGQHAAVDTQVRAGCCETEDSTQTAATPLPACQSPLCLLTCATSTCCVMLMGLHRALV